MSNLINCKITHQPPDIGTRYVIQFIAYSASQTIKFTNWGHICGTCTELVLDNVRLYAPSYLPVAVPLCTVGINEINANEVTIYPNPIDDMFTVKTTNPLSSEIIIYDVVSKKLFQQTFTGSVSLNAKFLSKGIYFYQVRNNREMVKGKIVKE